MSHQNKELRKELKAFAAKLDKAQTGSLAYNPALGGYMGAFINQYMSHSGNSQEFTNWQNSLKPYFAKDMDVSKLSDSDNWKQQDLTSADLVSIYVQDDVKIAQMRVKYRIKTKEELVKPEKNKDHKSGTKKEKKPKIKETWVGKTTYVNVPYQAKNNYFTVIAYPFVSPERSSKGHVSEALVRNGKASTTLSNTAINQVTKFTTKFFDKYVSSSNNEMSFIMADPVGLSGEYRVKSIEETHVSGNANKPRISGTILLEQVDTGVVHSEQFDLTLRKQDNTYFVLKFDH